MRARPELEVLLVSRPLAPGVHDGTVELVRTLAIESAASLRCTVFVPAGTRSPTPGVRGRPAALPEVLPRALRDRSWRPLSFLSLAAAPRGVIRHYFFTPTPRVVHLLRRLHQIRPGPSVQTLCSTPPDAVPLGPLLFADRVVALTEHTRRRLLTDGVDPARVVTIPPAVHPPDWMTSSAGGGTIDGARQRQRARTRHRLGLPADTPLILYMGDYDEAGAALAVAEALPRILTHTSAHAVLACRPKGAHHDEVRSLVKERLAASEVAADRVHLLGTIDWSRELAATADVALFPAARLPDKMDLPLALLESLVAGVPAVVADRGPLVDLIRAKAAVGAPADSPERLAAEAIRLLTDVGAHRIAAAGGRRWCEQEGSPSRLAERHLDLYTSLRT
ncbi:MAG: glycosyltransferase [bacterium]